MDGLGKVVCKGKYPRLKSCWSQEVVQLLKMMLTIDASKRPSIKEVLEYPALVQRRHYLSQGCDSWERGAVVRTIRMGNGGMHKLQDKLPKPAYTPERVQLPDIVQRDVENGARRALADMG